MAGPSSGPTVPSPFRIGEEDLGSRPFPYIVAEIGVNFGGDLGLAKKTIDAAVGSGADAVKFQTFHAEEFMADRELVYQYESGGVTVKESMYEMFKRLELPESWHPELRDYARSRGVEFLSSTADIEAVDLLVELGVPALKIASEDLINLPLLEYVSLQDIPVILSTGMADELEIDQAVQILRDGGCSDLLLLHCVSLYPTPENEMNLLRMVGLQQRYGTQVGLSDHTLNNNAAILATGLGAVMIEKHFTLDRNLSGPDHAISADPQDLSSLVRDVRKTTGILGSFELIPSPGERKSSRIQFRRSVVAAVRISSGSVISKDMLHLKRPGDGIQPRDMDELVGKRTTRTLEANEQLTWDAVE